MMYGRMKVSKRTLDNAVAQFSPNLLEAHEAFGKGDDRGLTAMSTFPFYVNQLVRLAAGNPENMRIVQRAKKYIDSARKQAEARSAAWSRFERYTDSDPLTPRKKIWMAYITLQNANWRDDDTMKGRKAVPPPSFPRRRPALTVIRRYDYLPAGLSRWIAYAELSDGRLLKATGIDRLEANGDLDVLITNAGAALKGRKSPGAYRAGVRR